jgi:hypothetical protein
MLCGHCVDFWEHVFLLLQEYYSLDGQSKWANFGYVCCFFLFFL